ncbi:DUF4178 domain-containing protein [Limibacter armeniacum]|uniref:DUF4178 domain-containing protein n=1 Tax=Limibacter armeniacum TaxID=466084 RepID=UPI002FE63E35
MIQDSYLPSSLTDYLPFDVASKLSELPEEAQMEFTYEMSRQEKNLPLAYFLHFMIMGSYGYQNKWLLQLLFWVTFGGLGVWWLALWFLIPGQIRRTNRKNAYKVIRRLMLKYNPKRRFSGHKEPKVDTRQLVKPRPLNIDVNPADLTINNLKKGYMVDHRMRTWKVVDEHQLDWHNGVTDREFHLVSDTDSLYIYLLNDKAHQTVLTMTKVNIFQLDENLERQLATLNRPSNVLSFNGEQYFRESELKGYLFEGFDGDQVRQWFYYSADRKKVIKILHVGRGGSLVATVGQVVGEEEFIDILPNS